MQAPNATTRVLRVLERNPADALTAEAIAERAGCSKRTAQNHLIELKREGKAFTRRDPTRVGCVFVWGRVSV